MGQDVILKKSSSICKWTTQYLIIITLLAFFTGFSVKNKRCTADIQKGDSFFTKGSTVEINSNYRLSFRVGFQGSHFREGSELWKTRKEVLAEGNTNSPPATGSLNKWLRPKANFQTTEIKWDGPDSFSNEKTIVTKECKSWQED